MSYYDLNAIQTDSQKLPCTFTLTVPRLGHLESPQNANQPITSGTKLYLPLWLGVMLALSNANSASNGGPGGEGMVEMDFPACLERKVINALKADGRAVDLRGLNAHFFGVGGRVLEVFEDEGVEGVLVETFRKRAAEIADHAHNARGALGEGAEFLRGLDETERQLFKSAHEGPKAVRQWVLDLKKNS